jgi:hypothetical protein
LVLFAISYTLSTVVQVQTVLLKATGNVRVVPLIWALSGAIVLAFAVPAMLAFGLTGGLLVMIASYATAALVAHRLAQSVEVRVA